MSVCFRDLSDLSKSEMKACSLPSCLFKQADNGIH